MDAGQSLGGRRVETGDAGVRVRAAEDLDVRQPVDGQVERVRFGAAHHPGGRGCGNRPSERLTGTVRFGGAHAADGVADGAITGAAAEISLQRARQVGALRGVERGRGHHHPGCAEPALESRRVDELPLHGMELVGTAETGGGGHLAVLRAMRRHHAGVHRGAVEQHGTGAAVPGVAALLDREPLLFPQEGA